MSEAVQQPSTVNDALGMLRQASNILFDCLSFFAILAIYLSTVLFSCAFVFLTALLFGKISSTAIDSVWSPSNEAMGTLCVFNGIFLGLLISLIALSGEENRSIPALWNALGVGSIVFGLLVVIEVVAVGIYSCYANMWSKKQDDVERLSLAHINSQQDEASIK
jgi:Gpi18-like mannosyltransferase